MLVRFQYSYREIDAGLPCKKQGAAWCGGFSPADTLATAWSHGGSAICNSALNKLFQWEERWKTNYHLILPAVKLRRVVLGSNSGEQWLVVCWFDFFPYSATVTTWTSRMTKDYDHCTTTHVLCLNDWIRPVRANRCDNDWGDLDHPK